MPISKFKGKVNWTTHFIDLLVVIIGVSAAFMVGNWAEKRKERKEIRIILNTMVNEIRQDLDAFSGNQLRKNEENASKLKKLLDIVYSEDPNADSLIYLFNHGVFSSYNWFITKSTFESIKESGKIDLIENYELKLEIRNLYEVRYSQSEFIIRQNVKMKDQIRSYLNEKVDMGDESTFIEVADDRKFRNLVREYHRLTRSKISEYKENYNDLSVVLEALKAELGNDFIEKTLEN